MISQSWVKTGRLLEMKSDTDINQEWNDRGDANAVTCAVSLTCLAQPRDPLMAMEIDSIKCLLLLNHFQIEMDNIWENTVIIFKFITYVGPYLIIFVLRKVWGQVEK